MDTILIFHAIASDKMEFYNNEVGAERYWVSLKNFHEQMGYLYKHNYCVTDIETLYRRTQDKRKSTLKDGIPEQPAVVLTFDDGDLSNYKIAYPVLREYGFKAYFFITVGSIGKSGTMTWEQIKELRNHGHIIGSHGMSHKILTTLDNDALDYELRVSKNILEDNLGEEIKYLSISRGIHNKNVLKKAEECGYKNVFTSVLGKNNFGKVDFVLRRISIGKDWDAKKLKSVLEGELPLKDKMADFLKKSSRKILGIKNYEKIRTNILK